MRLAFFGLLAVFALLAVTGCSMNNNGTCAQAPATCQNCGPAPGYANPGPPVGAVAYPYYTLHGPRDFLARNPRSIGP